MEPKKGSAVILGQFFAKTNQTETVFSDVFFDDDDSRLTGATVTVRITRLSDNKWLNGANWDATPTSDNTATELSATYIPGVYFFNLDTLVAEDTFFIIYSTDTTLGETVYQTASIESKLYPTVDSDAIVALNEDLLTRDISGDTTVDTVGGALNSAQTAKDDVWDSATSGSTTAGTFGLALGTTMTKLTVADQVWEEVLDGHSGVGDSAAEKLDSLGGDPSANEISSAVWNDTLAGHVGAGSTGKALSDLETDATAILLDTGTTIPAQVNALNDLSTNQVAGAILDAATSAHTTTGTIAKAISDTDSNAKNIDSNATAILLDTGTTLPAQITALNDLTAAQVNAEVDTALSDYDAPTKAELDTAVAAIDADLTSIETKIDAIDLTEQVTVTPIQSNISSPVDARDDITIYTDTSSPVVIWILLDADNDPIDVSGGTVTFLAIDDHGQTVLSKSTADDLSVGGANNNQVSMTYTTAETATVRSLTYTLTHVNVSTTVVAYGQFNINEAG